MEIAVFIDKVFQFKIKLEKETRVKDLKLILNKYENYRIEMLLNSKEKVKVFDSEKYDNMTFETVWEKINSGKIFLNKDLSKNLISVSTNRFVYSDFNLLNSKDEKLWEEVYNITIDPKYKKLTRNFSQIIKGKSSENPQIYLIPRERGGASYKNVNLVGAEADDIFFAHGNVLNII